MGVCGNKINLRKAIKMTTYNQFEISNFMPTGSPLGDFGQDMRLPDMGVPFWEKQNRRAYPIRTLYSCKKREDSSTINLEGKDTSISEGSRGGGRCRPCWGVRSGLYSAHQPGDRFKATLFGFRKRDDHQTRPRSMDRSIVAAREKTRCQALRPFSPGRREIRPSFFPSPCLGAP
jgi:hypothetical protein